MEDFDEAVQYDARVVIDHVLKREIFHNAKAVWLTPLLNTDAVYEAMVNSHHPGLCIIGDSDRQYTEERYRQILRNQNIESHLYPNINHGLDDATAVLASIDVLKSIMTAIENFERA